MNLREKAKSWVINQLGWSSTHPVVVIESDDWGMVRMASKPAQERLRDKGYPVDQCPYNRFDGPESVEDLTALSETLSAYSGADGSPAVMTVNIIMANPDFERIRESGFSCYHYVTLEQGLKDSGREDVLDAYRAAIEQGVLWPQLHGREHIAVSRWMTALRENMPGFRDAFDEGMSSVPTDPTMSSHRDCLDWLGSAPGDQGFDHLAGSIRDAQHLFEACWGRPSESFMAPCYTWHPQLESVCAEVGIQYGQGSRVQRVPPPGQTGAIKRRRHFTGQKNAHGQRYLVRNVDLEPSAHGDAEQCLAKALEQTEAALRHRTPAIVSSHRLNYIGSLEPDNRDRGLDVLNRYLAAVIARWPDVVFMSSNALGRRLSA